MKAASEVESLAEARTLLKQHGGEKNQKLTDIFKSHAASGGQSYSHVPLEKHEIR